MPESWLELWDVVSRNRVRTLLTISGVFWGMFMLILMIGFGNGLERGMQDTVGGTFTNAVFVWGRTASLPYRGLPANRSVRPSNAEIEALRELPGLAVLAPRNRLGGWRSGVNVVHGSELGNYQVNGDVPEWAEVQPMTFPLGRWLNQRDLDEERKVAVIGKPVMDDLYAPGEPVIGSVLTVNGVAFRVVGVFDTPLGGEDAERVENVVHLPFTTFQSAFASYRDYVGWFTATARPEVPASELEAAMRATLAERLVVHPDDLNAFGSRNSQEEFQKIVNLFAAIRLLVWVVGSATLLSGVVGVSNILLVTVRERTAEIGLRRALGATRVSVVTMILQEALMLTAVAGYAGLVVGVGVLELASSALGEGSGSMGPPSVDLRVALGAIGVLIVGGLFAGLIPARHAAAIEPAAALRS
ncbi:MAG: ABC transporter permease [Alphaproteobacteria bacterium]|nr:ABC transporter permease [Alphaproteobacteria bacterium]